jgi:hypothetical protein
MQKKRCRKRPFPSRQRWNLPNELTLYTLKWLPIQVSIIRFIINIEQVLFRFLLVNKRFFSLCQVAIYEWIVSDNGHPTLRMNNRYIWGGHVFFFTYPERIPQRDSKRWELMNVAKEEDLVESSQYEDTDSLFLMPAKPDENEDQSIISHFCENLTLATKTVCQTKITHTGVCRTLIFCSSQIENTKRQGQIRNKT